MYTFTAIPQMNLEYYGYTLEENQRYSFETDSFVNYDVTNEKTGEKFTIGDMDLFSTFETVDSEGNKSEDFLDFDWDIMPNMMIVDASDETICAALSEYEIEFQEHPFRDIAVERGFLRRVNNEEESIEFLDEAEFEMIDEEMCEIRFGMGYNWGKYISDDNESFYYSVIYYTKTGVVLVKREYETGEVLSSFSESGYNKITEKAKDLILANS